MSNFQPTNPIWRNGFSTGLNINTNFNIQNKNMGDIGNIPMGADSVYVGGVALTYVGVEIFPISVQLFDSPTAYNETE